jgi:hypothetical protein
MGSRARGFFIAGSTGLALGSVQNLILGSLAPRPLGLPAAWSALRATVLATKAEGA